MLTGRVSESQTCNRGFESCSKGNYEPVQHQNTGWKQGSGWWPHEANNKPSERGLQILLEIPNIYLFCKIRYYNTAMCLVERSPSTDMCEI